jgi:regulator of sigma E protease
MTFIWAVVLFGLLIFFHELGHFILAKLVGVKVLKFSLGFGPKIIGRKIGETKINLGHLTINQYGKGWRLSLQGQFLTLCWPL